MIFNSNYKQFQDKTVRELAWVIASPPLLQHEAFLPYSWFQNSYLHDLEFLLRLDKKPFPLHNFLAQKKNKRLGKYFESLLEFWFIESEQFDLIASNLQVLDGKRTVGEIDFILKDLKTDTVYHLEVAVKFYLQHESGEHFMQWIGPNTRDRLAFKYEKLLNKQLLILDDPSSEKLLEQFILKDVQRKCFFKGFFFYSNHSVSFLPNLFHPDHLRAKHLSFSGFVTVEFPYRFLNVEKHDWFSVPEVKSESLMVKKDAEQFVWQRMAVLPNPFMLIAFDEKNREVERFMIVPDSWPEFAF